MTNKSDSDIFGQYEARLLPYREAFSRRPSLALLGNAGNDPSLLHLFLIHYVAYGIEMTRPVEDWIQRAGEKCRETGFTELGEKLIAHARHESGHHKLMISDLRALTEQWNERHSATPIDPISLIQSKPPAGVRQYRELHEGIIAGDAAYSQIALEYEIESLSLSYGAKLVAAADGVLSNSARDGLTFLREHVALDAAHTRFNRREIMKLLAEHPDCLDALVDTAARALEAYGQFVDDCIRAALAMDCKVPARIIDHRLFQPPGAAAKNTPPEWLLWIRSLRSQILYDGGARPLFGPGGARYGDRDPADLECFHLALFEDDLPIGAARLSLGGNNRKLSLVDPTFGTENVNRCLARAGYRRDDCAEASRLVLHVGYRQGRNVQRLFGGLWSLAAESGAKAIIAAVGTRNHQDRLFSMFGARILGEAGTVDAPAFNDQLRLALFAVEPGSPPDYAELEYMREFIAQSYSRPELDRREFAAAV
jgi:hypothetical protein